MSELPPIIDMHSDIVSDVAERRARGERRVFATRHYSRLKRNGVKVIVAALWVEPKYNRMAPGRLIQLLGAILADLQECRQEAVLITSVEELRKLRSTPQIGVLLGCEGMPFVEEWPGDWQALRGEDERLWEKGRQALGILYQAGVRLGALTWGRSDFLAKGTGADGRDSGSGSDGLTTFGKGFIRHAERSGLTLDVSHLSDKAFWDVARNGGKPFIASHSNARALCDVGRNLTDPQIGVIADSGGIIGANSYPGFVDAENPSLQRYVDHLTYLAEKAGVESVGLGFDFVDYLPGEIFTQPEPKTRGFEDVTRIGELIEEMRKRGFSKGEIHYIAYGNMERFLAEHVLTPLL